MKSLKLVSLTTAISLLVLSTTAFAQDRTSYTNKVVNTTISTVIHPSANYSEVMFVGSSVDSNGNAHVTKLLVDPEEGLSKVVATYYVNIFNEYVGYGHITGGSDVIAVQGLLNTKINAGLTTDGSFGSLTYNAVKSFQASKGLSQDGVVGPNTWRALLQ
ncbi:peptidoglycan-binding domain-containing protein [Clostridium manihotivorum]|uniref:Peptidoglycan binding-like domain-containing protein n=1 Tax=Clostridium manihotivorum TaxID=2320868 RepID=A0A3R5UGA5_9CLOT|nr:peptidoglycan-binding domain-containing protein [Clostridium manihotivorum]QAA33058.1 hypothetical protein C1I91_16220 [Clostridium manihotivorum]